MKQTPNLPVIIGSLLIIFSLTILTLTFYPLIKEEISYRFKKHPQNTIVVKKGENVSGANVTNPIDENFGIVIPKIGANARVIANVDPFNENIYQKALTQGVAHAKGSSLPDQLGSIFIFSHSSVNFYQATRYNSVFYLISKLEKNDEIYVFYKGKKYKYTVTEKKVAKPEEISYLENKPGAKSLTLMTCTPAGTNLRRLLVIAQAVD